MKNIVSARIILLTTAFLTQIVSNVAIAESRVEQKGLYVVGFCIFSAACILGFAVTYLKND